MRRTIGIAIVAMGLVLMGGMGVGAQPASSAVGTCDVEPRTEDDIERLANLAATPVAATPAAITEIPTGGEAIAPETLAALEDTLAEVALCGATRDVARLLALYSDAYVVREVLAPEAVPILPGEPGTPTTVSGTPEVAAAPSTVSDARRLADGRVAAVVERDGRQELVVFIEVRGRWLIDATQGVAVTDGTPVASPDAGVNGDMVNLAPVRATMADAAATAGVDPEDVRLVTVEPVEWPDASLGCPEPGGFYAQVVTAGYRIVLDVGGVEVVYHTDEGTVVVRCDETG